MADTKYFAVVTDSGAKEMLEAVNEERKVNITHFAVGDGGGKYYVPDVTMTELKNEVWRGEIGSCRISEESENVMVVETVIPSNEGGFTIREMAVFDEKGIMVAVCNTPDTAKVKVTDGVVHELHLQMEILLNNKDSAQLVVNPNVVVATKKDIINLRIEMLQKMDSLYRLFCGYYYNQKEKKITSLRPHDYINGKLVFPEGAASLDGSKIVLQSTPAGSWPPIPDTGTGTPDIGSGTEGTGSLEEIAAAAAKIVEGNMVEIEAEQVKNMFRGEKA